MCNALSRVVAFCVALLFMGVVIAPHLACDGTGDKQQKFTEKDYEQALQFFTKGGWWSTRIEPEKDAAKEREWTICILTSKARLKEIKNVTIGAAQVIDDGTISLDMQRAVTDLLSQAPSAARKEFMKRFAGAIKKGEVAAALVKVRPGKEVDVPASGVTPLTEKAFAELTEKLTK